MFITKQVSSFAKMSRRLYYIELDPILASVLVLYNSAAIYLVFCNLSREKFSAFSTPTSADNKIGRVIEDL